MKTTNLFTAKVSFRQRMRRFWKTLDQYAVALESTPCDFLAERVQRLEAAVVQLSKSPLERSDEAGAMDMG